MKTWSELKAETLTPEQRERVAAKVAVQLIVDDDKAAVEAFVYSNTSALFPAARRVLLRLLEAAK